MAQLIWLLCIVLVPFTTIVLSSSSSVGPYDDGVYLGVLLAANAAVLLQNRLIAGSPAMHVEGADEKYGVITSTADTVASFAGVVITVTVPGVSLWPLVLMIPAGLIGRRLKRKAGRMESRIPITVSTGADPRGEGGGLR